MNDKEARKLLTEHVNALTLMLGKTPVEIDSNEVTEALESAKQGQKALRKSLLDRVKDLPVVAQVQQLGTAGTVAISAAAVTQADLAKDATEIFIAEVANDIVEERIEPPMFVDNFIDFYQLNDWGQQVIVERVQEAQSFVETKAESISSPEMISNEKSDEPDPKPESEPVSETSEEKSSDEKVEQDELKPEAKQEEEKETKTSKETNDDKNKDKSEPQEQTLKQKEDSQKPSGKEVDKETNPSDEKEEVVNKENNIPKIETPSIEEMDPIKPHDLVNPSPVQ